MVSDLGAAVNGALVVLGDELGIYTALAEVGPATSEQLAKKTKLHERQLREWLSAQAASGYVSYDAANDAFFLTPEQGAVFADRNSPAAMTGGFYAISAVYQDTRLVAEVFAPVRGCRGESITIASFAEQSDSSEPAIRPTSMTNGYLHWRAFSRS